MKGEIALNQWIKLKLKQLVIFLLLFIPILGIYLLILYLGIRSDIGFDLFILMFSFTFLSNILVLKRKRSKIVINNDLDKLNYKMSFKLEFSIFIILFIIGVLYSLISIFRDLTS